jgi:hypothetical protein
MNLVHANQGLFSQSCRECRFKNKDDSGQIPPDYRALALRLGSVLRVRAHTLGLRTRRRGFGNIAAFLK